MESVVVEKMWWGGKHPNSVQYRDAEYDQGKYTFVPNGVITIQQLILIHHIQKR
jgi:hypothetical protein